MRSMGHKPINAMLTDMKTNGNTMLKLAAPMLVLATLSACGKSSTATPDTAGFSSAPPSSAATSRDGSVDKAPAAAKQIAPAMAADAQINGYLCNPADAGCTAGTEPFAARSREEAAWLASHGYPTRQRYQQLSSMGLDQLQAEAAKGDRSAAVIYAQKTALVSKGFHDGAVMLHDEAVSGNLFAYYGLSDVYWNSPEHRNLVDSVAYLRVAYLLGDWKVTNKIGRLGLSAAENAAADSPGALRGASRPRRAAHPLPPLGSTAPSARAAQASWVEL